MTCGECHRPLFKDERFGFCTPCWSEHYRIISGDTFMTFLRIQDVFTR